MLGVAPSSIGVAHKKTNAYQTQMAFLELHHRVYTDSKFRQSIFNQDSSSAMIMVRANNCFFVYSNS